MDRLNISDETRARMIRDLQAHFASEFDEALSEFRAEALLELVLKSIAPAVYNQAVQDVRAHLQARLDDLDGEVYLDS
ncbi:MAG: DUF2164 domain-containing protein [Pseudomonadota bacterium]